jgi:hypothetical protein
MLGDHVDDAAPELTHGFRVEIENRRRRERHGTKVARSRHAAP